MGDILLYLFVVWSILGTVFCVANLPRLIENTFEWKTWIIFFLIIGPFGILTGLFLGFLFSVMRGMIDLGDWLFK